MVPGSSFVPKVKLGESLTSSSSDHLLDITLLSCGGVSNLTKSILNSIYITRKLVPTFSCPCFLSSVGDCGIELNCLELVLDLCLSSVGRSGLDSDRIGLSLAGDPGCP